MHAPLLVSAQQSQQTQPQTMMALRPRSIINTGDSFFVDNTVDSPQVVFRRKQSTSNDSQDSLSQV